MISHTIGLYGISEQDIHERLQAAELTATLYDNDGEWQLQITSETEEDAAGQLKKLHEIFNVYVYGTDVPDLQTRVVKLLQEHQFTLATAESCTGGMLSELLTTVPGASAVFECGVAAYSATIKNELIGVSADTIYRYGTIAPQTAAEMAAGVRRVGHATLGIGITGAAGPTASEGHPAGTVFVAIADEKRVWNKEIRVDGATLGRDKVRRLAVLQALDLARRYLEAWPTVMAGGAPIESAQTEATTPPSAPIKARSWKERLLPTVKNGRAANFRLLAMWILGALSVTAAIWLTVLYLL